jgi:hypothetical protein
VNETIFACPRSRAETDASYAEKLNLLFSSEGTSCIHCPQNGYLFQLHRLTENSKSAFWTMMGLSTRSCSPVTKREPNGPMLQTKSTSTFSRRSGANGLSAIKSKPRHLGSRIGTIIADHYRGDRPKRMV